MTYRRFAALCGLAGPAVLAIGSIVPALAYRGRFGETFTPLNHFVSELGEVGVSALAPVFNTSLVASGLLLAALVVAAGRELRTGLGWVATAFGVVAALSCSAVGLVPMDDLYPHLMVANGFFFGGMIAVGLFSAAVARDPRRSLPRWLALPGLVAFACFLAFVPLPWVAGFEALRDFDLASFVRPDVWSVAILEWLVLASVLGWVVCVAGVLARKDSRQAR